MSKEHNFNALDDLLKKAKEKTSDKSLWRFIYERLDDIEQSKNNGLTYKEMASELQVSMTSFLTAKKKAVQFRRAEITKAEQRERAEQTELSERAELARAELELLRAKAGAIEDQVETPKPAITLPPVPGSKRKPFESISL